MNVVIEQSRRRRRNGGAPHRSDRTVVIGAGPYGLATAAALRRAGHEPTVFGRVMSFWQEQMPTGMLLRSPVCASSIDRIGSIEEFARQTGRELHKPVPLGMFVEYGEWFQQRFVPQVDERLVRKVRWADGEFQLTLSDAAELTADRVVVAGGIATFRRIPSSYAGWPSELVSHTADHRDLSVFAGKRVLVVGGGQSALESSALLHEAGATPHQIVRHPSVHWLGQRAWLHSLGALSRAMYAPAEIGPPVLSRLVEAPSWFARIPSGSRQRLTTRAIRPAGASWLKDRVLGRVDLRLGTTVASLAPRQDHLLATLDDGTSLEVDHVLLGTGYQVDIHHYDFLDASLLSRISTVDGSPVLTRSLESSLPGLHFVGAPAVRTVGPLVRFVAGAEGAAAFVTAGVTAPRSRQLVG